MRLYLSSFRVGAAGDALVAMVDQPARAAVVANAMDAAPPEVRREAVELELAALRDLGLDAMELDLRNYVDDGPRLAADLTGFQLLWVRGGNVFVLRSAMARSHADDIVRDVLARDALVYGGYSAGPCALGPSLRGLEEVDDPTAVTVAYGDGAEVVWDGIGVLDRAFVPHVASPEHPESAACDRLAAGLRAQGIAHWALRDGQVLVVDGGEVALC